MSPDGAIYEHRDRDRDDDKDERPDPQGLGGHLVHGDDHDLAGEDEVGGDGALDDLGLRRRATFNGRGLLGLVVAAKLVPDLLGALVAEVGAARMRMNGMAPGMKALISSSAGRMISSLLRSEPQKIFLIIGSSRDGSAPETYCGVTAASSMTTPAALAPAFAAPAATSSSEAAAMRARAATSSSRATRPPLTGHPGTAHRRISGRGNHGQGAYFACSEYMATGSAVTGNTRVGRAGKTGRAKLPGTHRGS